MIKFFKRLFSARPESNVQGSLNESILVHYCALEILMALDDVGIWTHLWDGGSGTSHELAQQFNCNESMLSAALEFLWINTQILEKQKSYYKIASSVTWQLDNTIISAGSYAPVLSHIHELMSGTLTYGKDLARDGAKLQKASLYFTRPVIPVLNRLLNTYAIDTVVDLGCGSAELLIQYTQSRAGIDGVGVDVNVGSLKKAKENIARANLLEKITLVQQDLRDVKQLGAHVRKEGKIAFTAVAVLHEFLSPDEKALILLLELYRKHFSGHYFFIVEHDARTAEEIKNMRDEYIRGLASFYKLIHPFSLQGDPQPKSRWVHLFKEAGLSLHGVERARNGLVVYIIRL